MPGQSFASCLLTLSAAADESETGEDVIEESPADPVNASPWVLLITKKVPAALA